MESEKLNIALILDGNRRWARKNGKAMLDGHKKGFESVKNIVVNSLDRTDLASFTLYAFSTENWNRDKSEINLLMKLFKKVLVDEFDDMIKNGIKLIHIGRKDRLPKDLVDLLIKTEEKSANNTKLIIYLGIDYGGKDEIIRAVNKFNIDNPKTEEITEEYLSRYLDIPEIHKPQILIRTSNEHRLSNFLLWHLAYTEVFFVDKNLPDFTYSDFKSIVSEYSSRSRRFGK